MTSSDQKILQLLGEAHATERMLVRVLQSQIAMTPASTHRDGLEKHLDETRSHADRVGTRLRELGEGTGVRAGVARATTGIVKFAAGQALALTKTPLDLVRGGLEGEEKVLRNARDSCAAEATEIAIYTAIERLARESGDDTTAKLASSILADEERMLARLQREIGRLALDVVAAQDGDGRFDVAETGAAQTVRAAASRAEDATRSAARAAGRTARDAGDRVDDAAEDAAGRARRTARRVPKVADAEGAARGLVASGSDLPIAGYDDLTADEILSRLRGLSQVELATLETYERRHDGRSTVLGRIESLRGDEPLPGYDELTAREVQSALTKLPDERVAAVLAYERSHKERAGVIDAAQRAHATA